MHVVPQWHSPRLFWPHSPASLFIFMTRDDCIAALLLLTLTHFSLSLDYIQRHYIHDGHSLFVCYRVDLIFFSLSPLSLESTIWETIEERQLYTISPSLDRPGHHFIYSHYYVHEFCLDILSSRSLASFKSHPSAREAIFSSAAESATLIGCQGRERKKFVFFFFLYTRKD